jgi:hypothetical protein
MEPLSLVVGKFLLVPVDTAVIIDPKAHRLRDNLIEPIPISTHVTATLPDRAVRRW